MLVEQFLDGCRRGTRGDVRDQALEDFLEMEIKEAVEDFCVFEHGGVEDVDTKLLGVEIEALVGQAEGRQVAAFDAPERHFADQRGVRMMRFDGAAELAPEPERWPQRMVEAQAGDAAVEPMLRGRNDVLARVRVIEVELREFLEIEVAEIRAVLAPIKPIAITAAPIAAGLLKERMAHMDVIGHEIHDQPDAAGFTGANQLAEGFFAAKAGLDAEKVGDVIAVIGRGAVEGRKPDGICAEIGDVIQLPGDSLQIASAKNGAFLASILRSMPPTAAAREAIDQNLIDHRFSEPVGSAHKVSPMSVRAFLPDPLSRFAVEREPKAAGERLCSKHDARLSLIWVSRKRIDA